VSLDLAIWFNILQNSEFHEFKLP